MIKEYILNANIDECLAMIFARTISSIILHANDLLLEDFRKYNTMSLLIGKTRFLEKYDKYNNAITTIMILSREHGERRSDFRLAYPTATNPAQFVSHFRFD